MRLSVWVTGVLTLGCGDGFFHEPAAPEAASLALAYRLPAAAAVGPSEAFDQVDEIRLTVVGAQSSETLLDSVEPFESQGQETRISLPVEIEGTSEEVVLSVVLSAPDGPVFSGQSRVTLTRGQATAAEVSLIGVAAGLQVEQDLPELTAIGESLTVGAVTVFATGDTLGPVTVAIESLDPTVVAASGNRVTAVGEGTAELVGSLGTLSDRTRVTVALEVSSVEVEPSTATILIGEQAALVATPRDRNANPVSGRTVTWRSVDPGIATVSDDGVVTGVSLGSVDIFADVDAASGFASVEVTAEPPEARTLPASDIQLDRADVNGEVDPGGATTTAWFEWDTDPAFSQSEQTQPVTVGAGTDPVSVSATLTGLTPQTVYYYRVVAQNVAGSSTSDPASFATPPRTPTQLSATQEDSSPPIFTLRWVFVGGPVDFFVERQIKADPWTVLGTTTVPFFQDTVAFGVEYSYRVRACFEGSCSGYSNVVTVLP